MARLCTLGGMGAELTAGRPAGPGLLASAKRWWPWGRAAATVAMLAVLLHWVKLRSLFPVWDHSTLWWLAGGVACTTTAIILSAVRWQRVLAAMDQGTDLGTLVNAYLACQFVSNFLPSTIGGDAVRVTRVSARPGEVGGGPPPPAAFASVVLDRMSGWLILPLLCLTGLFLNPGLLRLGNSTRAALALSLITLLSLVATVTVAASTRLGGRLAHHSNWLRFMGAVHLGLDRIRRRPGAVF
jgi:glycosyltransferase 2 family protein